LNLKTANEISMGIVEEMKVSELTKDMTFSAVAAFVWTLYKKGYEIVPVRFQPAISLEEVEQMKDDGVIY
jgi:hypothetical protein